jgi:hypothetical protein
MHGSPILLDLDARPKALKVATGFVERKEALTSTRWFEGIGVRLPPTWQNRGRKVAKNVAAGKSLSDHQLI